MSATTCSHVSSGNEAVLIVEDDHALRELLCRAMRSRGYHVLSAGNGHDALSVADGHGGPIDLVVSDLVMPGMNGLQLFARLRGWYPGVRFLFISGFASAPTHDEAYKDNRTAFLPKPFSLDRLAREGRALLDEFRPQRMTRAARGSAE